ncbi:MAG TPA: hypothetical protein VHO66_05540 [Ruminiclostridium sp.]|nr:hypothetical protein [Ruminiclostridium sp.]
MLSQNQNILLETIYKFGGYVTVPAVMAWKHISAAGARKSISCALNIGYLEEVEFTDIKNYPAFYRLSNSGLFYLKKHSTRNIDTIYAYSILYKVIKSHAFFELAGEGVTDIFTLNTDKISFLKSLGYKDKVFDKHAMNGSTFPVFRDYIIKGEHGFTSLYIDRGYDNVGHVLATRLAHLKNFIKDEIAQVNLLIITDKVERKDAFLWAYGAQNFIEMPQKFDCRLLNYCYSRV